MFFNVLQMSAYESPVQGTDEDVVASPLLYVLDRQGPVLQR